MDRIGSDSRLVWGAPGGDIEGLFLGEETEKVRNLERIIYRGAVNWAERRMHVLGGGGSSGRLSSCSVPQQSLGGDLGAQPRACCPAWAPEAEWKLQEGKT